VHLGGGRGGKAEHDLGLDARLGERRQRKWVLCCLARRREIAHRGVEHESPHRGVYAIFGPNGTGGETDLAADDALAARRSQRAQAGRDAIGVVEAKAGIAHGERCNLARAVHRRERLSRDSFVIWWGKDHAAHHTWRLRQRPSATPVRFEMRASLQRRFFSSPFAFLNVAPHEARHAPRIGRCPLSGANRKTFGSSEPCRFRRLFGSIHSTCLSALATDRAMEAWYPPSIA